MVICISSPQAHMNIYTYQGNW